MNWPLIAVVVSIAGLPLTLIALFLRTLRLQQRDLVSWVQRIEREYTTKREWERELMQMRSQLDRLAEMISELATRVRTDHGLLAQWERERRRMVVMSERDDDETRRTVKS